MDNHSTSAEDWLEQCTKDGKVTHVIKGYWTGKPTACLVCSHHYTIKHETYLTNLDQRLPFAFRIKFNIFYRFKQGIEIAFSCHYLNGITEGINNKIKVIKRVAYSYRNFHYFRLRILINQSYFLFGV